MVEGVLTVGAESAAGRRRYTNPRRWRFGARCLRIRGRIDVDPTTAGPSTSHYHQLPSRRSFGEGDITISPVLRARRQPSNQQL
jgi:hypothetical protein